MSEADGAGAPGAPGGAGPASAAGGASDADAPGATPPTSPRRPLRRAADAVSTFFYRRGALLRWTLLSPPLLWLVVAFAGALAVLVWQSAYQFDDFTMQVKHELTTANYRALYARSNLDIVLRTAGMAGAVTVGCALLAFPLAYYMARYTRGATRALFYLGVMLPMWASYIVKVYAWTMILSQGGIIHWLADHTGLRPVLDWIVTLPYVGGGSTLSTSNLGRFLVFTYAWLPFMILPIQAAIERVPPKLLEASADLGARPLQTFRAVLLPLAFPGVVAGSIFTFSLTLGDYIIPPLVGPPGAYIGTMVNLQQGSVGNLPMAAAFTAVPIAIMAVYLVLARRLGAFDAL